MEKPQFDLEARMQKISLGTSVLSLGLMLAGFVDVLAHGTSFSVPGMAAPSLRRVVSGAPVPAGLILMSAGIALLSLLPLLRVLLAMSLYARRRQMLNVLAALVVLVELLFSTSMGA